MPDPRPLVDSRIYPGQGRRGRYARLLVFVTQREMYAYVRASGLSPGRGARAFCLDSTVVSGSGLRFADLVFQAGFHGYASAHIAHECLHALLRLRTDAEVVSALADMEEEERLLAYPLGRMVSRTGNAIWAIENGLAFQQPRGNALKAMRRVVKGGKLNGEDRMVDFS